MPNEDQVAHWGGAGGELWVAEHDRLDRMYAPFVGDLVDALDLQPGERVLDFGCGAGAVTWAAARAVAPGGEALGVDLSPQLLALARSRGTGGARFEEADAQTADLGPPFDAWTSRFGVMFFDDPPAAFANLVGALRPGGRVAFLCWQELAANEWQRVLAAVLADEVGAAVPDRSGAGAFALADPDRIRRLLAGAGLSDIAVEPRTRPLLLGETGDDALRFLLHTQLVRTMLADAGDATAQRARHALAAALERHRTGEGVTLGSATWLVTARR